MGAEAPAVGARTRRLDGAGSSEARRFGVVMPCNTASVTALDSVRDALGPGVPVVGTVPAIKPAAAECRNIAIWATAATTDSQYQADLIAEFGNGATVTGVACHGLADAIDAGDKASIGAAITAAAELTPTGVEGVVLGCTHYPLVEDEIVAALGGFGAYFRQRGSGRSANAAPTRRSGWRGRGVTWFGGGFRQR